MSCGSSPLACQHSTSIHPFENHADFNFAAHVVKWRQKNTEIDELLSHLHSSWTDTGSSVSFKTHRDLHVVLNRTVALTTPV